MYTPLALRAPKVRLITGWFAQALNNYAVCKPANTAQRAFSCMTENRVHPYIRMWHNIGHVYLALGFNKLSDEEIIDIYNAAIKVGYKNSYGNISAEGLRKAVVEWDKRGWTRYESKRDKRHKLFNKGLVMGAVLCTGLDVGIFAEG